MAIAQAFTSFATDRPRPIHLEIPLDVLADPSHVIDASFTSLERPEGRFDHASVAVSPRPPDPALVSAAADLLAAARRPVMIVGGGARWSAPAVIELAELLGAAVLSTTNGKGTVPDDHPLLVTAALHLPAVNELIDDADVVLAIGTELASTDFWAGPPSWRGRLIRIDVDPQQLLINATPDIAIAADATPTLTALIMRLGGRHAVERATNHMINAEVKGQARAEGERWLPWLDAISAALGDDAIVVADNAMACYYGALGNLPVRRPGGYCFPTGFGTLGYALPAAIGAKIANPEVNVVAICGDGGLMFSVQEIATAAAERVSLPIVVFDNGGYGEIRAEMRTAGIEPLGVELPVPHFVDLACALGGHGVAPTTPAELTAELVHAFARPGPTLLAIKEPS